MIKTDEYQAPAGTLFSIQPMDAADYDQVILLWKSTEGMGISRADSRDAITRYLLRNLGLSLVAWTLEKDPENGVFRSTLAGAVLCGHDGRRGLLHHLAVHPAWRGQGVGRRLVEICLEGLRAEGIDKCHLFVFNENIVGQQFWKSCGWKERTELMLMSIDTRL